MNLTLKFSWFAASLTLVHDRMECPSSPQMNCVPFWPTSLFVSCHSVTQVNITSSAMGARMSLPTNQHLLDWTGPQHAHCHVSYCCCQGRRSDSDEEQEDVNSLLVSCPHHCRRELLEYNCKPEHDKKSHDYDTYFRITLSVIAQTIITDKITFHE